MNLTNKNILLTGADGSIGSHLKEIFKDCQTENIENAEWLADRMVNIPSSVI